MASKVKSINGLMKHLREANKINISGSSQKQKLRNIGYYHGYKGYRYIENSNNRIMYSDFNEVMAMNEFDMNLKTLFYPQIMFIETALKNYVLEVVLDETGTDSFIDIYANLLIDYKTYGHGTVKYKDAMKKRLDLRNKIYGALTNNYKTKPVVQHFYHKDKNVPIWAIFEIITLGDFGFFVSCLHRNIRMSVAKLMSLNSTCNSDGKLAVAIIFALKDLRNAVAHNDVIFDTRFKTANINKTLIQCLELDTKVININFSTIVDYLILVCYILKNLGVSKIEIYKMINTFINATESLRKKIPFKIYSQIIHTNSRNKIKELQKYIKLLHK
jgi:abortive infection bacteriophage resistance protein